MAFSISNRRFRRLLDCNNDAGISRVFRACNAIGVKLGCQSLEQLFLGNGTLCICQGELCNGAGLIPTSPPAMYNPATYATTLSAASESIVVTLAAATGVVLLIATRRLH